MARIEYGSGCLKASTRSMPIGKESNHSDGNKDGSNDDDDFDDDEEDGNSDTVTTKKGGKHDPGEADAKKQGNDDNLDKGHRVQKISKCHRNGVMCPCIFYLQRDVIANQIHFPMSPKHDFIVTLAANLTRVAKTTVGPIKAKQQREWVSQCSENAF